MTKAGRGKYNTKEDRVTPEQVLESKMLKHSLDRIWLGLTNSEKKEALLVSEIMTEKKMEKFEKGMENIFCN